MSDVDLDYIAEAKLAHHQTLFSNLLSSAERLLAERDKLQRILEIERNQQHSFCPDCRDKVKDEPCLRCQQQHLEAELAEAKAENERLCEALEKIRDHYHYECIPYVQNLDVKKIARDALAGKEET